MHRFIFLIAFATFQLSGFAQQVTDIIYFNAKGITENPKKAIAFTVVKKYADHFEQLEYKNPGPLKKRCAYADAAFTILHGKCYNYMPNGAVLSMGQYDHNEKTGDWYIFNDTGKVITQEIFKKGQLVSTENYGDSSRMPTVDTGYNEAEFPGGMKAWTSRLVKILTSSEAASKSQKGGKVVVNFAVGTDGSVEDVFIGKSVEYVLDEEAYAIISKSPKWKPATNKEGKTLKAFRRQPISFMVQ